MSNICNKQNIGIQWQFAAVIICQTIHDHLLSEESCLENMSDGVVGYKK